VLDPKNYLKALSTTVEDFYLEDCGRHGRLEEVKKIVTEFDDVNLGIDQAILGRFSYNHSEVYRKLTGKEDEDGLK
jgi:hypothetical protein